MSTGDLSKHLVNIWKNIFFFFGSTTSNRDGGITAADLKVGVFMD